MIRGILLFIAFIAVSLFVGIDSAELFSKDVSPEQLAQMQDVIGNKANLVAAFLKLPFLSLFIMLAFLVHFVTLVFCIYIKI